MGTTTVRSAVLGAAMAWTACGGGGNPTEGPRDAAEDVDAGAFDASIPDARSPTTSEQIAAARAQADGSGLALRIDDAVVTYVIPAIGTAPAGFTVQADRLGPALLIAVDASALSPTPGPGDVVSFTIETMSTAAGGARQASALQDWDVSEVGTSLAALVQSVDGALVLDNPLAFESELISLSVLLSGPLAFVAPQLVEGPVEGLPGLRLRVPRGLQQTLQLGRGCSFALGPVPLLRADDVTVLPFYAAGDTPSIDCDELRVEAADSLGATGVRVRFDRALDPGSVLPDGSQFTFDGGLVATAAAAEGRDVLITTTKQAESSYVVTAATTGLTDIRGQLVGVGHHEATFDAASPVPTVQINEVSATQDGGCDLIELRVRSVGNLRGHVLRAGRDQVLATFDDLPVVADDAVVVHLRGDDAGCNPDGHTLERAYPAEATGPSDRNFASAFDWWASGVADLASDEAVLVLADSRGEIVDAVLLDDQAVPATNDRTDLAAAEVAESRAWLAADGSAVDAFLDEAFFNAAATDLDATSGDRGNSLQRVDDADDDRRSDWVVAASTWGLRNNGQARTPAPSSFDKHILLEMFTGTWCQFCPDGYARAAALEGTYGERLVTMTLHQGSATLSNADGDARLAAYQPAGYPQGGIDSDISAPISRGGWAAAVATRADLTPRCGLSLDARDPAEVTARVACASAPVGQLRLQLWLVQREQFGPDQVNSYNTTAGHPYFDAGNPIVDFRHTWIARDNLTSSALGDVVDVALATSDALSVRAAIPPGQCVGECWIYGTIAVEAAGGHRAENTRRAKVGTVSRW